MWLLIIMAVGFVIWYFLPESPPPKPKPKFRNDLRANADDPQWRSIVDEHSESPAETAFLTAMIDAYQLLPKFGSLTGKGLKLDFQVQEGPYRVDFLADDWLVIEIDGAAWHSSPEALARDRKRDDYFEGLGYTVLRIPAKVVFNDPSDAVNRVRSALTVGKREIKASAQINGFHRMGQTVSAVNGAIGHIHEFAKRERAVKDAMSQSNLAFSLEREAIDIGLSHAQGRIEIDDWRSSSSPEMNKMYDDSKAELYKRRENKPKVPVISDKIPDFVRPTAYGDPEIDRIIEAHFDSLSQKRIEYFYNTRQKMESSPRLKIYTKEFLVLADRSEVWAQLLE
jgi:very-short-patch-repair endonuclease